jgi:hypothetical protein
MDVPSEGGAEDLEVGEAVLMGARCCSLPLPGDADAAVAPSPRTRVNELHRGSSTLATAGCPGTRGRVIYTDDYLTRFVLE